MPDVPVVAIDTNPDLVEMMKARIETAGFVALVIHIGDIRAGLDVETIVAQHDPVVVVYDVVMPYERNWRFLEHLRETSFKGRRFVITTPNEKGIRKLVGRDDKVYEVVDSGGDIHPVVQAVREAARARPTR